MLWCQENESPCQRLLQEFPSAEVVHLRQPTAASMHRSFTCWEGSTLLEADPSAPASTKQSARQLGLDATEDGFLRLWPHSFDTHGRLSEYILNSWRSSSFPQCCAVLQGFFVACFRKSPEPGRATEKGNAQT